MDSLLQSHLFRSFLFLGAASVIAIVWFGDTVVKLAEEDTAPTAVALAGDAGGVDFTPTGSIGKPVILNPCVMEPKR